VSLRGFWEALARHGQRGAAVSVEGPNVVGQPGTHVTMRDSAGISIVRLESCTVGSWSTPPKCVGLKVEDATNGSPRCFNLRVLVNGKTAELHENVRMAPWWRRALGWLGRVFSRRRDEMED